MRGVPLGSGWLSTWVKPGCLLLACAIALLGGSGPAGAHQSPAGCTGNSINLDIARTPAQITNGQNVTYTLSVRNDASGACDVTNAAVTFNCPAPDGTPTGPLQTVVTGQSYPAGTAPVNIGTKICTVTVNPGVISAQAKADLSGVLHDVLIDNTPDVDPDAASASKTQSVVVLQVAMSVTKSCQPAVGAQLINVSGTVTNTGSDTLVNLACTDSQGAVLTLSSTTIAPSGSVTYTGSYTPTTNPSTDTVTCTATGQTTQTPVTAQSNPATCQVTVTTTLVTHPNPATGNINAVLNDSATLSGGINPTGSITFSLFPPSDPTCSGAPSFTQTKTVNGNGTYSTSGGPAASVVGVWHWQVDYSGDANNPPAHSGCLAETVTITKAIPTLSEWGMLLMVLLLVGIGLRTMSRRPDNPAAA